MILAGTADNYAFLFNRRREGGNKTSRPVGIVDYCHLAANLALQVIDRLKILLNPFLPFTTQQLHRYLGYEDDIFGTLNIEEIVDARGTHPVLRYDGSQIEARWQPETLLPGQALQKPAALYKKLDESIVDEERARLVKRLGSS